MSPLARSVFLLWLLMLPSSRNAFDRKKTRKHHKFHCKSADDDLGVQLLHPNASFQRCFIVPFNGKMPFTGLIYTMQEGIAPNLIRVVGYKKDGSSLSVFEERTGGYPWKK
ncbi:Plant self-incompatibility S1 [Spatholobus suberectus]|nr:Plant self-incompatibility S1 [Spatholobus suberectus]